MKKIIILCENCFDEINKKHIRIKSAEIRFDQQKFSPIVLDHRDNSIHFCCIKCLSAFFRDKLLKAKK